MERRRSRRDREVLFITPLPYNSIYSLPVYYPVLQIPHYPKYDPTQRQKILFSFYKQSLINNTDA